MQLTKQLLNELDSPSLSVNERAVFRCRLARQFEAAGDYEAASEAMAELWQGIGARPELEGLDEETKAQVLLRVGVLTGWIGSAGQIEGSQEAGKDLISESLRMFEQLDQRSSVGEARSDLALCYWRAGAFDEARVTLQEALREFDEGYVERRAIALLRSAEVERASKRLSEALRVYNEAAPLFAELTDDLLIAHFHHGFANVLNQLSTLEDSKEYVDRALIEYTAASFHFEQAGQERYEACVENNLGFLFSSIGKFEDAHEHLDRAQVLLTKLEDVLRLAQVDETRARVLLAEGRIVEAEKIVRAAVHTLGKGDEVSWLAEALTTHGIALARLKHPEQARAALERAVNISEQAGGFESAGVSALVIVEQIGRNLSTRELCETIDRAGMLLEKTQDISILRRLGKAVFESLFLAHAVPAPPDWEGFSLKDAMRRYEAHLIKLALKETGGMVTAASRLLGFRHHQSLITLIGRRHKELIETGARAPVRPRRSHLIVHPKRTKKKKVQTPHPPVTSRISILHVEDNEQIANLVREIFVGEGWHVELCADGYGALEKLTGNNHYDVLIVDNDLPGLSGIELVERARKMRHRNRTPIVMLSGSNCETEAWGVGVQAFLRKPEQVSELPSTINRLLEVQRKKD